MTDDAAGASFDVDAGQNVGLVVVSHSRSLAQAAVALANEMVHGRAVRIEVAAGLDETTFGTDAVSIMEAIERADGPAGVVVLMDLGSALLSAELALDLLRDPSVRDRVTLSPAPVVEGLVVAAVAAAGGASRSEVAAEARDALMGKAAHLSTPTEGDGSLPVETAAAGGGRRVRRRQPPRAARPTRSPAGQRGARTRRDGGAAQPHHGRRAGPGGKPEPRGDAGSPAGTPGGGACLGLPGPGGGRAHPGARQAPVRRERRGACAGSGPGRCRYAAVGHGEGREADRCLLLRESRSGRRAG